MIDRLEDRSTLHMTTLAVLLLVYGVTTQFLADNGPVAAFVFGLLLGNRHLKEESLADALEARAAAEDLTRFHGEVTFLIRTFFFVYLGLLFDLSGDLATPLLLALLLTGIFLAARAPTVLALARRWSMPSRDRTVLAGTVARGVTGAVILLYGAQVGLVPPEDLGFLTDAYLLMVLFAAVATSLLVVRAERTAPGEEDVFPLARAEGFRPEEVLEMPPLVGFHREGRGPPDDVGSDRGD